MSVKFTQVKRVNGERRTITRMLNREAFHILMKACYENAQARKTAREDIMNERKDNRG